MKAKYQKPDRFVSCNLLTLNAASGIRVRKKDITSNGPTLRSIVLSSINN